MRHGADWYKRNPTAYLGGVQGMSSKEHAVFAVVLDLIYQHGGSVNDDPAWFAGWISDMGSSAVRKAISSLIERGKLHREGDQLTNGYAKSEAKTKQNLSETRAKHGQKGGKESGKSRAAVNKNKGIAEPNASPREDKRRLDIKEDTKVSPKKKTRIPADAVVSDQMIEIAEAEGHSSAEAHAQFERFKDYATANGKMYVDWNAAFRNWFRSPYFKPITTGGSNGPASTDTQLQSILDAAAAR